jgi:hypothetical protein
MKIDEWSDTLHAMHPTLKEAIKKALAMSEDVALPVADATIAAAARRCVRAQLDVDAPDSYVIHRCLRTLHRQLRHANPGENQNEADLEDARAIVESCVGATAPWADHLYAWIAPKARLLKAVVQMLIGAFAVVDLGTQMWSKHIWWRPGFPSAKDSLELIGAALAAATVVELAYTLFTDGPDEVLDPLMLGITTFMIIELGMTTTHITWGTGVGLLLSTIALGALFAIRQRFIEDMAPVPPFWWRRLWSK